MQQAKLQKKEIVNHFLNHGVLLSQDILEALEDENTFKEVEKLIKDHPKDLAVLNNRLKELLDKPSKDINWDELDRAKALSEKKQDDKYDSKIEPLKDNQEKEQTQESIDEFPVKVISTYEGKPKKSTSQDFIDHFNQRFRSIRSILRNRQELQNILSISRVLSKREKDQVAVVGMVSDKQYTKNNNCMLTIEDESGSISVLVSKNRKDLFEQARDIVLDEVIGISGTNSERIIFANSILFPDIPASSEIKKCDDDAYVLFLSDIHVGSIDFLGEDFEKFLKWINQDLGDEKQKEIASKVRYIFVIGDLVDGCGIYPGQDEELDIKDIKDQYKACADFLSRIPKNIKLIVCPGNHDAMRVAEPQLPIYKDFSEPLYELPNITMVSNPAIINIHSSENFPGFEVLLYHGYSFDYYVAEVESIRNDGGYDRADLVMKFLLQKRHLAPSHSSTLYTPDPTTDPLVINSVPDFFVSGHIHKTAAANYRGVTLISGSCWQRKTAFQEKVGHHPEPSRVPIVNLKTRNIKILRFGSEDE